MRKVLASLVAVITALTIGVTGASAHTGSVTANCTTVTFSYNANFAHSTVVTEKYTVDGVASTKTFTVPANHTATDVITFTSPNKASFVITAGATWTDGTAAGSIATATFTPSGCAVVCVPKTVYVDKIVYVDREVIKYVDKIVYVDKPVEKIVYVDRPVEVTKYVDREVVKEVPGPTQYITVEVPGATVTKVVTVVKYKTKIVNHVKVKIKTVVKIKLVPKKYPHTT